MKKLQIILLLGMMSLFVNAQVVKKVTWTDLVTKIEFDDPFLKLSSKQLFTLSQVARIREKEENPDIKISATEMSRKDSMENLLEEQNVDIDSLLSIRYKIADLRHQQKEAVNEELNNKNIEIAGYLLPLNYVDKKVTEFLLVPWVGACIHTPPPPKNQLVYFTLNEGIFPENRFQAVVVSGKVTLENKTSTLFLIDGTDDITSGYSIFEARIKEL